MIKNDTQNGSKIEPWVFLGLIFEIFERLGRRLFFDAFFDRQKVSPKSQKSAKWAANGEPEPISVAYGNVPAPGL